MGRLPTLGTEPSQKRSRKPNTNSVSNLMNGRPSMQPELCTICPDSPHCQNTALLDSSYGEAPGSRVPGSKCYLFPRHTIIKPPSQTAFPAILWPPPRMLTTHSLSRPGPPTTSSVVRHRAIAAGRRSIIPFQMRRQPDKRHPAAAIARVGSKTVSSLNPHEDTAN